MLKLVKEIRSKKGELHFKRWQFCSTRWFNIYLHYIAKADEDEHLHDHPWSFWSIILKGGYIEFTKEGSVRRTFLHSCFREKSFPHKIGVLIEPTWSLVITGKGGRNWGYATDKGWIDNKTYRENKRTEEVKKMFPGPINL